MMANRVMKWGNNLATILFLLTLIAVGISFGYLLIWSCYQLWGIIVG